MRACRNVRFPGGVLMAERRIPRVPGGLAASGKRLWKAIWLDLDEGWELDSREVELLERACATADHIALLEGVVARDGVTAAGSKGQVVAHPALLELRQQKLALLRLLGALELVDPAVARGRATPAAQRARRAAEARWGRRAGGDRG